MKDELVSYIESVYRERYHLLLNNCFSKSLRIRARVKKAGEEVDIILSVVVGPAPGRKGLPYVLPHVYTMINGEKVDVALDPELEKRLGRNSEQRIYLPLNISRVKRILLRQSSRTAANKSVVYSGKSHGY